MWGWWDEHDWNRSVSSLPFHALVECVKHLMFCLLEHVECGHVKISGPAFTSRICHLQ
jgi:hypothetical protein